MNKRFHRLFKAASNSYSVDHIMSIILKQHNIFDIRFSTFHSFALDVIKTHYEKSNMEYPKLIDEAINKRVLIGQIFNKVNGYIPNDYLIEDIMGNIALFKNNACELKTLNTEIPGIFKIYDLYEKFKTNKNLIDYEDMLLICYNLLQNNSNYLENYSYIQVDEAQDNTLIQYLIVKLLAKHHDNMFLVGDDDQSIYGFRGTNPKYMMDFSDTFPNLKIIYMTNNFRSTKSLVTTSNNFVKNNKIRYKKDMYTDNVEGTPIEIVKANNEAAQYLYIIKDIKNNYKLPKQQIAILYRNTISSIVLADALSINDIEFYIKDYSLNFFSHWLTKDVISILKYSLGINNDDFNELTLNKKDITIKDNVFKEIADLRPFEAINLIENLYEKYINKIILLGYPVEYIENMFSTLKIIAKNSPSLHYFINRIYELRIILEESKSKTKSNLVLMTMHSCKGLEFEKVYIIDLIENQFPSKKAIMDFDNGNEMTLEEERRVCYVAMTRARKHLDMIVLKTKNGKKVEPSRFINEIEEIQIPKTFE